MKILLTGNLGTIGKDLQKKLAGQEVAGFDIKAGQDITKSDAISKFIKDNNFDIVIHAAAIPHPHGIKDKDAFIKFWDVNVLGTKNVVFACLDNNVKKFIYISSGGVYGWDDKYNADETEVEVEPYTTSKRIAEAIVTWAAGQKLCSSILRLAPYGQPNSYEVWFNATSDDNSIYKYILQAIDNKKWLSIYNVSVERDINGIAPVWPLGELKQVRLPDYSNKGGILCL